MTGLFSQMNLLGNALNAAEQNHLVLSENLANINTPGYRAKRIAFDEVLKKLDSPDAQHGTIGELTIADDNSTPERVDGNNVNLEKELSEIKKNALAYQAYAQLMSSRMQIMRRAISG